MRGICRVKIKNSRNSYQFELRRNITILKGESGRGKTTLYDMIRDYNSFGRESGVSISCDKSILTLEGKDWEDNLTKIENSIVVIDEDSKFVRSKDFADRVDGSSNYFLIITRNYLAQLPYSVEEIYELQGENNKKFRKVYSEIYRMYDNPYKGALPFLPEVIITEDEKSGYQFFRNVSEDNNINCISAGGKSNILRILKENDKKDVVIIADGAAIGAEIEDLVNKQRLSNRKIAIFLPESFEWLILKSGIIGNIDKNKIDVPYDNIDSEKFVSWERYFTDLLIKSTKENKYMKYEKSHLSDFYLQDANVEKIKNVINGIKFDNGKGQNENK